MFLQTTNIIFICLNTHSTITMFSNTETNNLWAMNAFIQQFSYLICLNTVHADIAVPIYAYMAEGVTLSTLS